MSTSSSWIQIYLPEMEQNYPEIPSDYQEEKSKKRRKALCLLGLAS
jgi:hypothetical protein